MLPQTTSSFAFVFIFCLFGLHCNELFSLLKKNTLNDVIDV